jgi:hypothetical protein
MDWTVINSGRKLGRGTLQPGRQPFPLSLFLRSGRKTYSPTEEELWLMTSRSGGANTPKQTELSTNNTVLVPKVEFGRDENRLYGDCRFSKQCCQ